MHLRMQGSRRNQLESVFRDDQLDRQFGVRAVPGSLQKGVEHQVPRHQHRTPEHAMRNISGQQSQLDQIRRPGEVVAVEVGFDAHVGQKEVRVVPEHDRGRQGGAQHRAVERGDAHRDQDLVQAWVVDAALIELPLLREQLANSLQVEVV